MKKKCGSHHLILGNMDNYWRVAERYRGWHAGANTEAGVLFFYPQVSLLNSMGKEVCHPGHECHLLDLCQRHGCSTAQKGELPILVWKWGFVISTGLKKGNQELEGGSHRALRILRIVLWDVLCVSAWVSLGRGGKERWWKTLWAKPSIFVKDIEHYSIKKNIWWCVSALIISMASQGRCKRMHLPQMQWNKQRFTWCLENILS